MSRKIAKTRKAESPEVYKFGGASLGNAAAFLNAAEIARRCPAPLTVVCSAPSGTTDLLLEAAERARHGDAAKVKTAVTALREKFATIIEALKLPARARAALEAEIMASFNELETLASGMLVLREL